MRKAISIVSLMFIIFVLVGGLSLFLMERPPLFFEAAQAEDNSLYRKILSLAAAGNSTALTKLSAIEDFLGLRGITSSRLKEEHINNRTIAVNDRDVYVKGIRPFFLKIYNDPQIATSHDLDKYIESRTQALRGLANRDSRGVIEIAISPAEKMSLEDLDRLRQRYGLNLQKLVFDVFVEGEWDHVIGIGGNTEEGELTLIDFSKNAQGIRRQLLALERSLPLPPSEMDSRPRPKSMNFTVRFARARTTGQEARALQQEELILLVDPITDLKRHFRKQALEIKVVQMPQLYGIKKSILKQKADPETQSRWDSSAGFPNTPVIPQLPPR